MGAGVPEHKLILTSYGWSPKRFPHFLSDKPLSDTITVLFVGERLRQKRSSSAVEGLGKSGN
jgi:hypothetical protein